MQKRIPLIVALIATAAFAESPAGMNLIPNPGFEQIDARTHRPANWHVYQKDSALFRENGGHSGKRYAHSSTNPRAPTSTSNQNGFPRVPTGNTSLRPGSAQKTHAAPVCISISTTNSERAFATSTNASPAPRQNGRNSPSQPLRHATPSRFPLSSMHISATWDHSMSTMFPCPSQAGKTLWLSL